MRHVRTPGSLALALLLAAPAAAHHSAAGIDRTRTVTVVGSVRQFKWANPHSWMEVEVPNVGHYLRLTAWVNLDQPPQLGAGFFDRFRGQEFAGRGWDGV